MTTDLSRRDALKLLGGATAAMSMPSGSGVESGPQGSGVVDERARRMQWWHDARFGMFIHWGSYSVLGRHEWSMENEAIPVAEYERLATQFTPKRAYLLADKAPVDMKTENGRTVLNIDRPIFDPMATVIVVEIEGDKVERTR